MNPISEHESGAPFAALRRLALPKARQERCEFCNLDLATEHRHLLEVEKHKLVCVCDPCGLRFQDLVGGRFELVPRDARALPGFCLTDAQWESLALPINLAFFVRSRATGKVRALYPSPAGVTESLLTLGALGSYRGGEPGAGGNGAGGRGAAGKPRWQDPGVLHCAD